MQTQIAPPGPAFRAQKPQEGSMLASAADVAVDTIVAAAEIAATLTAGGAVGAGTGYLASKFIPVSDAKVVSQLNDILKNINFPKITVDMCYSKQHRPFFKKLLETAKGQAKYQNKHPIIGTCTVVGAIGLLFLKTIFTPSGSDNGPS